MRWGPGFGRATRLRNVLMAITGLIIRQCCNRYDFNYEVGMRKSRNAD
jgi:hypothetical protein